MVHKLGQKVFLCFDKVHDLQVRVSGYETSSLDRKKIIKMIFCQFQMLRSTLSCLSPMVISTHRIFPYKGYVSILTTLASLLRSMVMTLEIKLASKGLRGLGLSRNSHSIARRRSLLLNCSTMVKTSEVSNSQAKCGYLERVQKIYTRKVLLQRIYHVGAYRIA